jgi:hypothetical protein
MAAVAAAFAVVAAGLTWQPFRKIPASGDGLGPLAFVGSETCASCHQNEAELWRTSHHKLAMDHATDSSVLGDFSGVVFTYYGVNSRFFRKGSSSLSRPTDLTES